MIYKQIHIHADTHTHTYTHTDTHTYIYTNRNTQIYKNKLFHLTFFQDRTDDMAN